MALVTVAELKAALGIGDIYPDPTVQAACDAAIAVLDPFLTYKRYAITAVTYVYPAGYALYETAEPHKFNVDDDVTISTYEGSPFTGTQTVTEVGTYWFKTDKVHGNQHDREWLVPYGSAIDNELVDYYDDKENVRAAALAIAIDVWQTQMGTTAQTGLDMAPAPYKMGKGLLTRVMGLLGPNVNLSSWVG